MPGKPCVFRSSASFSLLLGLVWGCQGAVSGPTGQDETQNPPPDEPPQVVTEEAWNTPASGMRRLSQWEYANTVKDLLGFEPVRAFEILPSDGRTPFDNNAETQAPSDTLISGAERLATSIAEEFISDTDARTELLPCSPTGTDDASCFRSFVEQLTTHAFRRPLESEEVDRFASLLSFAEESDDFFVGVESVLIAVLQDPRFLYRLEIGTADEEDPMLHHLDGFDVATRLSFLIWGTTPSPWLMERAADGDLRDPVELAAVAREMLDAPEALGQAARYHELWFDYESIGAPTDLAAGFRTETNALVERVIKDGLPWTAVLTLDETYVNEELATHYGIDAPSGDGFGWVDLSGTDRGGLLSHGAFLTDEGGAPETNPTRRGAEIRGRLFCQVLEVPADLPMADPDEVIETDENACTPVRLASHASGGCAGCHSLTDPIGFGLEQYDMMGRFREHESDKPECTIDGQGEVAGVGEFSGSRELGELLSGLEDVRSCFVQQLTRFSTGRSESTPADRALSKAIAERWGPEMTYRDAILSLVTHQSFLERRLETEETVGE